MIATYRAVSVHDFLLMKQEMAYLMSCCEPAFMQREFRRNRDFSGATIKYPGSLEPLTWWGKSCRTQRRQLQIRQSQQRGRNSGVEHA
ncbi:hypothetical protein BSF43_32470 [Pseudomonas ogarae]|nr:hypothetical protein BSF43_32470 [Pseudomonas ogarae]